jgi:hypothetical protein
VRRDAAVQRVTQLTKRRPARRSQAAAVSA